jgi:hypothetical protein
MKKWLIALVSFCLLLIGGVYIFIPGTLIISTIVTITSAKNATNRFLLDETRWHKWWPNQESRYASDSVSSFFYNGYSYHITEIFTDKINVLTINGPDTLTTSINILPINNSNVTLQWQGSLATSLNPLEKILQYRKGTRIKKNMTSIFQTLQAFLEKNSNVYGFPIEEIISKDSTLIATKYVSKSYPEVKEIYGLIDTMKKYIVKQGAIQTNHPMLRVSIINDSIYQTLVAIPTNKVLNGNGLFFFQRFVPYKTLTGKVRGGVRSIEMAFKQMEIFVDDHQRTSMAVPFQLLVSDRTFETDSLKWITVICQPVS